jgi:Zn-finger nucleic acid-binding protein
MTDPVTALQPGGRACPNCSVAMQRGDFEHRAGGVVQVELCVDCRGIWFDAFESVQLSAAATLDIFRIVNAARERPERALGAHLHCAACRGLLDLTHDIQRTTRFTYYRCRNDHGRFTPFVQFLREKELVRALTPAEVTRLKATVRQVRCTSCGATVDVGSQPACPYCGAPFEILDADALEHTLARLEGEARARPSQPDPARVLDAVVSARLALAHEPSIEPRATAIDGVVDLVADALGLFIHGATR